MTSHTHSLTLPAFGALLLACAGCGSSGKEPGDLRKSKRGAPTMHRFHAEPDRASNCAGGPESHGQEPEVPLTPEERIDRMVVDVARLAKEEVNAMITALEAEDNARRHEAAAYVEEVREQRQALYPGFYSSQRSLNDAQ